MLYPFFIQSLAIIAVIFFILSFHTKSRRSILIMQLLSLITWATHFYLLSAWTGSVLIVINGMITVLFLFKHKNKIFSKPIILYLSLFVLIIVTIITWQKFYSIFPLLAVISITIAKWQNKSNMIRIISIPASIFWIIYDLFVGSYGSIIAEILIMISIMSSLYQNKNLKNLK